MFKLFCGGSLPGGNALPAQQPRFNLSKLIRGQNAKTAQELLGWQCLNPLDEECAVLKKSRRHGNLKLRASRGRGVRDHADQGAVRIPIRNADDQSRTNLLRYAEVHLPYLSTFRHAECSPLRPARGKKPQPKPRNRHPSNRQTWEHVQQWRVEVHDAPFPRVAPPRQEFGRLLVSCPEHTHAERIEQALGRQKEGPMSEDSQGGEVKRAEPEIYTDEKTAGHLAGHGRAACVYGTSLTNISRNGSKRGIACRNKLRAGSGENPCKHWRLSRFGIACHNGAKAGIRLRQGYGGQDGGSGGARTRNLCRDRAAL